MLYKSGSYEINDRAAETLSKIAKIITDYKDYDVLIEGNTDNVPVNTQAASMKNIRNNWDLSALRASSVVQYLINHFGVAPEDPCDVNYSGTLVMGNSWMRIKI